MLQIEKEDLVKFLKEKGLKKEVYKCETCGGELNYDALVFVIDGKLFHNEVKCLWDYSKKTGRKITGRSPMNLKDAIKKLKS